MAHVETDECGASEFFSNGTKLLTVGGPGGKVDLDAVEQTVKKRTDIHYPKPKVLSVTQTTELGTLYTPEELIAIHGVTKRLDLKLHMDGARFANAVAALDIHPKELTWRAGVDVLTFGGTKSGMPVGEAVVFFDKELAYEFDYRCKQAGQLASKMRYLSAPWRARHATRQRHTQTCRTCQCLCKETVQGPDRHTRYRTGQPDRGECRFCKNPRRRHKSSPQHGMGFLYLHRFRTLPVHVLMGNK